MKIMKNVLINTCNALLNFHIILINIIDRTYKRKRAYFIKRANSLTIFDTVFDYISCFRRICIYIYIYVNTFELSIAVTKEWT